MKRYTAWAIIPAYNEAERIIPVIKETAKYVTHIVIVDDGSSDNTYEIARKIAYKTSNKTVTIYALSHIINMGKGAALKTGCDFALKHNAKVLIAIDADGQHEPREIPLFLEKLKGKGMVFGYRAFSKKMPFIFRFGNEVLNTVINLLYGISLKDTQCGYRVITADAYKKVRWEASDYTMESEMIARAGKHKIAFAEKKIKTIYADRYKGTTVLDGIKIVWNMIIWRLRGI